MCVFSVFVILLTLLRSALLSLAPSNPQNTHPHPAEEEAGICVCVGVIEEHVVLAENQ